MNLPRVSSHRQHQGGAAAVEFAIVLPVMILILWGLTTMGSVLYAQMSLSRAAADGVRALGTINGISSYQSVPEDVKASVRLEVIHSLALSLLAPTGLGDYDARVGWMQENILPNVSVDNQSCGGGNAGADVLRVRVSYPYSSIRILPPISLPMVGSMDGWMPQTLTGCATARL
ncbi:MAG TPA: TadE family protein [Solimonas sp.]